MRAFWLRISKDMVRRVRTSTRGCRSNGFRTPRRERVMVAAPRSRRRSGYINEGAVMAPHTTCQFLPGHQWARRKPSGEPQWPISDSHSDT
jgi:hypothetical protein